MTKIRRGARWFRLRDRAKKRLNEALQKMEIFDTEMAAMLALSAAADLANATAIIRKMEQEQHAQKVASDE